jgi:hypothetical protein
MAVGSAAKSCARSTSPIPRRPRGPSGTAPSPSGRCRLIEASRATCGVSESRSNGSPTFPQPTDSPERACHSPDRAWPTGAYSRRWASASSRPASRPFRVHRPHAPSRADRWPSSGRWIGSAGCVRSGALGESPLRQRCRAGCAPRRMLTQSPSPSSRFAKRYPVRFQPRDSQNSSASERCCPLVRKMSAAPCSRAQASARSRRAVPIPRPR